MSIETELVKLRTLLNGALNEATKIETKALIASPDYFQAAAAHAKGISALMTEALVLIGHRGQ